MLGQAGWVVCVLLAGSVGAQENTDSPAFAKPPAWRIAPEVFHYRYREPGIMTNEGTFYGVAGSYTFRDRGDPAIDPADGDSEALRSTLRLDGRLAFGEVDYDGSLMNGTPFSFNGSDDFLVNIRLLWDREWRPARFVNAVYAGLGYRYLSDDSSDLIGGYRRESNYLYVPLGSRKDFELTQRWDLSLTGEFDVLIFGYQVSHLDDASPALPTVRNWQWPGIGLSLAADVRRRLGSCDLGFSPFLRYWWVAKSGTSADGYYEPENNTLEYGVSLVVRF